MVKFFGWILHEIARRRKEKKIKKNKEINRAP